MEHESSELEKCMHDEKPNIARIIIRAFGIIFAIVLIVVSVFTILITIFEYKKIIGIINQLVNNTTYINTTAILNIIQYFSSKLVSVFSSVLLIISGVFLIKNNYKWKKYFLLAIVIIIVEVILSVLITVYTFK